MGGRWSAGGFLLGVGVVTVIFLKWFADLVTGTLLHPVNSDPTLPARPRENRPSYAPEVLRSPSYGFGSPLHLEGDNVRKPLTGVEADAVPGPDITGTAAPETVEYNFTMGRELSLVPAANAEGLTR